MGMSQVARCKEKFVLLQNWSNEINIAQLSLKYGTMKLQLQSIKPLASIFFLNSILSYNFHTIGRFLYKNPYHVKNPY